MFDPAGVAAIASAPLSLNRAAAALVVRLVKNTVELDQQRRPGVLRRESLRDDLLAFGVLGMVSSSESPWCGWNTWHRLQMTTCVTLPVSRNVGGGVEGPVETKPWPAVPREAATFRGVPSGPAIILDRDIPRTEIHDIPGVADRGHNVPAAPTDQAGCIVGDLGPCSLGNAPCVPALLVVNTNAVMVTVEVMRLNRPHLPGNRRAIVDVAGIFPECRGRQV